MRLVSGQKLITTFKPLSPPLSHEKKNEKKEMFNNNKGGYQITDEICKN
jgi:hypothetical protein